MRAAFILIFLLLFILGCGAEEEFIDDGVDDTGELEITGDPDVDVVGDVIADFDDLEEEFDDSELNGLEEDLANLDW